MRKSPPPSLPFSSSPPCTSMAFPLIPTLFFPSPPCQIFTDTGNYVLEMETTQEAGTIEQHPLSLEERSVMLASAVSIDVDYFSRHSSHGHGYV